MQKPCKAFATVPRAVALALCLLAPGLAPAQEVQPCDWPASAANLAEPWEETTRTFANGAVRIALLDTVEPGVGPLRLLVLSPPRDILGIRQCRVIGTDGAGFADVMFPALRAGYDPATGLTFTLPVRRLDPATGAIVAHLLTFTVNQATGAIGTRLE